MNSLFYILLFIFGTMFGSFASVIIHRLKSGETGIWGGRSHCKSCNRNLTATELIPIFSWIFQRGKCKKCHKKISAIYPVLEITTAILFIGIGFFLIDNSLIFTGNIYEIIKLCILLCIGFLTIIYTFYDILYLEIPESVLAIANILVFGVLVFQDFPSVHIGVFAISVAVIGGLYTIMLKGLKEIHDCIILASCIIGVFLCIYSSGISYTDSSLLSGIIGALGVFSFFFLQILISQGRWMGGGDLRIAILMGLSLGVSLSFAGVMLGYFIGSIVGIGLILISKIKDGWNTKFNSQIPFGPFLASGYFGVLFFQPQIENLIKIYF